MTDKQKDFMKYVKSFYYDDDAPYRFDVPLKTLEDVCIFISKSPYFQGDSVDREHVRTCLEMAGYREVKRNEYTFINQGEIKQ